MQKHSSFGGCFCITGLGENQFTGSARNGAEKIVCTTYRPMYNEGMAQPNIRQLQAFERETRENDEVEERFEREGFVRDFLTFAGRLAYGTSGGGSGRGR